MTNLLFQLSDFVSHIDLTGSFEYVELREADSPGISGSRISSGKPQRLTPDASGNCTFTNIFANEYDVILHGLVGNRVFNRKFNISVPDNAGTLNVINCLTTSTTNTNSASLAYPMVTSDRLFQRVITSGSTFNITASSAVTASHIADSVTINGPTLSGESSIFGFLQFLGETDPSAMSSDDRGGLIIQNSSGNVYLDYQANISASKFVSSTAGIGFIGSASYALSSKSASWAPSVGGSGTTLATGSLVPITSSVAITALTASTVSQNQNVLTLLTGSNNGITASFSGSINQQVNITTGKSYSITASNVPASGVADIVLKLNNTAVVTSSLTFPATWFSYNGGFPTSITASKSAYVWLRYNGSSIDGTFLQQL